MEVSGMATPSDDHPPANGDSRGMTDGELAAFIDTINPYPDWYDSQRDGIETIRAAGLDHGYAAVEGACGTGKTLMALAAGLSLVRDPDTVYERVLCLTSVKQQLRAFEDDVQAINATLEDDDAVEPVTGVTMVGKQDLCAYDAAGVTLPGDSGFYQSCESLRDTVSNALKGADGAEQFRQLERLLAIGRADAAAPGESGEAALETEDWSAPHQRRVPRDGEQETRFCPFYAKSVRESMDDAAGADPDLSLTGMHTPADIRAQAGDAGICPHVAMRESLEDADVLVGNYLHAFDPLTRERMTGDVIGPETFLVIDEAHSLVANVRDLLSDDLALTTVIDAVGEVLPPADRRDDQALAGDLLRAREHPELQAEIDVEAVQRLGRFLEDLRRFIENDAVRVLDEEYPGWNDTPDRVAPATPDSRDARTVESPLGAPDKDKPDRLSLWLKREDYDEDLETLVTIAEDIAEIHVALTDVPGSGGKKQPALATVARVLMRWRETGNVQYYRTVALTRRQHTRGKDLAWRREFRAQLRLHNCIPRDALAHQFDWYGGGVLMSATLAPLAEYRREVGLELLQREVADRSVREAVYGLSFPEPNRLSLAVDAEKFTYDNRGSYDPTSPPATARFNDCREAYADAIAAAVAATPGNILVAAPSYAEGQWVRQALEEAGVDRPVLVDESSSDAATEDLKARFFAGDGKVLVTSLRGTLTEGVDYDGDRLAGVVVLGVPIRPTNGDYPTAIEHAYRGAFGSDGWELAFGVPAVRKARQAIGRVIRGPDEVGVRLYLDERYTGRAGWSDVSEHLPEYERAEFQPIDPGQVGDRVAAFWSDDADATPTGNTAGLSEFT